MLGKLTLWGLGYPEPAKQLPRAGPGAWGGPTQGPHMAPQVLPRRLGSDPRVKQSRRPPALPGAAETQQSVSKNPVA